MKLKFSLFTLLLVCCFFGVSSQVNLQNGAAQLSIPLYSYSDLNNRIGVGISLDYIDGNGLRVNEMPAAVGTGWNLGVGGVITRVQHGEPDDQLNGGLQPWTIYGDYYYPDGFMYAPSNYGTVVDVGASHSVLLLGPGERRLAKQYLYDTEQDEYTFNFNGRSGTFVIGKNKTFKLIQDPDSKLQLSMVETDMHADPNYPTRTRISEFDIIDENGIKYIFKDVERSQVIKYSDTRDQNLNPVAFTFSNAILGNAITLGKPLPQFVICKWYLSEIDNPLTHAKITFTYEDYSIDINSTLSEERSVQSGTSTWQYSISLCRIMGVDKRLKSINCSTREQVQFEYSGARFDLPFDKALNRIKVLYNNQIKYSWNFSYGYFYNDGTNHTSINSFTDNTLNDDTKRKEERLCLLSLQKQGQADNVEPPYQFNYNLGLVPAVFSYYHDHWGYINIDAANVSSARHEAYDVPSQLQTGINGGGPLLYPFRWDGRAVQDGAAQWGIIQSIKYPTGGTLSFVYEQNTAFDPPSNTTIKTGGVRVAKTILYDGMDAGKNISTEYKYLMSDETTTSGWGYEPLVYTQQTAATIYKTGSYQYPGININEAVSSIPRVINGFGKLGLLSTDAATGEYVVSTFDLAAAFFVTLAIDIIVNQIWGSATTTTNCTITQNFTDPINGNNLLPMQYSRVEVITRSTNNNTNGKVVYDFTSNQDYTVYRPTQSFPYSFAPRCQYWFYGIPKAISVYDNNNNLVKKTINSYITNSALVSDPNFWSQKWEPDNKIYYPEGSADPGGGHIVTDAYAPISGWLQLYTVQEIIYNALNQNTSTTTTYQYANNYKVKQVTSFNSKNEKLDTYIYYPFDYTVAGTLQTMQQYNIINSPVSTQTFITKPGGLYLTKGTVNEYNTISNGDIKITQSDAFQNSVPVSQSLVPYSQSQLIPNTQYYQPIQTISYNTLGTPTQITVHNNNNSKIYDYENRYVIAEIANTTSDQVAYTSFEADGNGNWTGIVNLNIVTDNQCPTGFSFYNATNFDLYKSNLAAATTYIVSYWTKNGVPYSITGTIAGWPKSLKTISRNGQSWTYYEHRVTGQTVIHITGTGSLDELRLYPQNARMTTYSYDPLVGVISQCDVNNRLLYSHYDDLGRLTLVQDEDNNILKKYCYKYSGQTENCTLNIASNWKANGINQCKPCGQNSSYISNIQQHQEQDVNPLSPTYYTYRWIDDGVSGNCNPAAWQNTTTPTRCKALSPSGEVEQEQKDVNPCSSTYNTTRWIVTGTSASCPSYVTVTGYNNSAAPFNIKFTDHTSGTIYAFTVNATTNPYNLLVPIGSYDVLIYPASNSITATFNLNGSQQVGTGASYTNISINSSSTYSIN